MSKGYVIINDVDKYYVDRDDNKNEPIFKRDICYAKFFKEEVKARYTVELLKKEHFKKYNEYNTFKIAAVKFKIHILN